MRNLTKKVVRLLSIGFTSIILSSCTAGSIDNLVSSFQSTINSRVDWNIEQLNRLKGAGLVTDSMFNGLVENIQNRTSQITKADEDSLQKVVTNIIKPSLSYVINDTGDPFSGITGSDLSNTPTFKNYVDNISGVKDFLGSNKGNPSDGVKPLEIFATKDTTKSSGGQSLNEILKSKIYVLNADISGRDLSDIAIAMNTIKELKDKKDLTAEEKDKLAKARTWLGYFKETDMSLLDGNTSLTRVTSPNDKAYEIATGDSIPSDSNEGLNKAEDGKDLVIFSDTVPVMGIRLQELDNKVIDNILKQVNDAGDSYLIDYINGDKNQGARIYKMFYPVSYVDSISYNSATSSAKIQTKESDLINVNIMTGKVNLIKENSLYKADELKDMEPLYNVLGNSDNESSFTIWNKGQFKETHNGIETEYTSNSILLKDYLEYTYLPGFIPNEPFVALGRKIRLYGIQQDGSFKDPSAIGKFIDKLGSPVQGASEIQLGDLLDSSSGYGSNDKKGIKLSSASGGGATTKTTAGGTPVYVGGSFSQQTIGGAQTSFWQYTKPDGSKLDSGWAYIDDDSDGMAECYYFQGGKALVSTTVDGYELNDKGQWVSNGALQQYEVNSANTSSGVDNNNSSTGLASDVNKAKFNSFEYADTIHPTSVFPSNTNGINIASTDAKDNGTSKSKLIHYGLFVNTNLYKSQLYSGWLNTVGEGSGGSLNWWNEWLRKAKFTYSIDKNKLAEYLNVNFTADMSDSDKDLVVLDKDTLVDIQNKMDKDNRNTFINKIRTLFVALGFFCFVYSIALLGAWAIDVNTMLAVKILGILTFGKFVAISDSIDKPTISNGKVYVTFAGIMSRLIALTGLGIILINVDFLVVVGNIYNAVKGLTDFISQGLFGK